ncbi:MAG: hypothetical protein H6P98_415 [Candidatus Aminicenantes bacterium]|nr:hypothetical protein [Candidatus Aminicenantes bacterium]
MNSRFFKISLHRAGSASAPLLALAAGLSGLFVFTLVGPPSQEAQTKLTPPGPLSRAHGSFEGELNCTKCHSAGKRIEAARCLACHQNVSDRMAAKKGVHREVTGDCEACHQEHQGVEADIRPLDPAEFDHAAETGFAFEGKHAGLAKNCPACHKVRSYMANQRDCGFCHAEPHQGTMPQKCEACHTPAGWTSIARGFHKAGTFPLEGRHLEVPCASCHINGIYKGTPMRCYDCHWIRRQDDVYRTALGTDCENCHRPVSWTAVRWDHAAQTGMALNGAHRNLSCDSCHKDGNFRRISFDCYSCHREDYEETSEPNHRQAAFPTTCEFCHLPSQTSWEQASFNHNSVFPRQGVHATLDCSACHKNGVYAGTPRECYGCHRTDYEQTQDPNHRAAGFPTTCEVCHRSSDSSWDQASFNHASIYPLQGVHATLDCSACHKNGIYAGTPRECYGCHRTDYEQARDPNHVAAGFPTTCESCHRASDTSWDQARFNHTWFPITSGRHAGNDCSACHPNPSNFTVFTCLTCHTRGDTDEHHGGVSGYRYDSAACYSCHPQGRAD